MSQEQPIRVLIADDHLVVCAGLAAMLEIQPLENIWVVGQTHNGREAVEMFIQLQPGIALIDLRLPEMDGVAAIKAIREQVPTARTILVTTYDSDKDIYRGLQTGAQAYLLKKAPCEELLECIRAVHTGHLFIPPLVAAKLAQWVRSPELSERELEVMRLIVDGKSNREIGTVLYIAERTVKFHVKNILSKLGVKDRTQAVVAALKRGLVQL